MQQEELAADGASEKITADKILHGVKIKNIYGIPDDDEKAQMKNKKKVNEATKALESKKDSFKNAFAKFSKSLKEDDFDAAMKIKNDLIENDGQTKESLDKIKINTNSLFKKSFEFPEVAKNDFATDLFEELEISEKNVNANLDNVDLYNNFIETAEKVKKSLIDKYADQWHDPTAPEEPKSDSNVQADDE